MKIQFIPRDEVTKTQQQMIDAVNKACFGFEPDQFKPEQGHIFGAVEAGVCALWDGGAIVGVAYIYKRLSDYEGQEFYIGGFGGLGILPPYRGRGCARRMVEEALKRSYEIGVDVACLFIERQQTVYQFYQRLGYRFIGRDAYCIDSRGEERAVADVMVLGLRNEELAQKICATGGKFHYGAGEGCW